VLIDSRTLKAGDLFAALPGTRTDGHEFVAAAAAAGAAGALVSRPVDAALPKVVVADVAKAWARRGGPGARISMAHGRGRREQCKTTTKEMLAAILGARGVPGDPRQSHNQLGVPLTLLRLREGHASAVIEMGANRAGDVAELMALARPDIGLITNAGAEHLEGFGISTAWRAPRVRSSRGWAPKAWRSSTPMILMRPVAQHDRARI